MPLFGMYVYYPNIMKSNGGMPSNTDGKLEVVVGGTFAPHLEKVLGSLDVLRVTPILVNMCRTNFSSNNPDEIDRYLDKQLQNAELPPALTDQTIVVQLWKALATMNTGGFSHENIMAALDKLLARRRALREAGTVEVAQKSLATLARSSAGLVVVNSSHLTELVMIPNAADATAEIATGAVLANFFVRSTSQLAGTNLMGDIKTAYDSLESVAIALKEMQLLTSGTAEQRAKFIGMLEQIKAEYEDTICLTLKKTIGEIKTYRSILEVREELKSIAATLGELKVEVSGLTGEIEDDFEQLTKTFAAKFSWIFMAIAYIANDKHTEKTKNSLENKLTAASKDIAVLKTSNPLAVTDHVGYILQLKTLIAECDQILRTTNPASCSEKTQTLLTESRKFRESVQ